MQRNTERRRKGNRMDERDTEEERKDRETEWWGIERKMLFLEVFSFNFVEIKLYAGI
jgi:hypothetical protein